MTIYVVCVGLRGITPPTLGMFADASLEKALTDAIICGERQEKRQHRSIKIVRKFSRILRKLKKYGNYDECADEGLFFHLKEINVIVV